MKKKRKKIYRILETCTNSSTDTTQIPKRTETDRNGHLKTEKDRNRQQQTDKSNNGQKQTDTDRKGQKRTEMD